MPAAPPSTTVKSALRTLDIIEFVVAHPQGAVAQDIAAALDIPVSSLSYLLATLVDRSYLTRDGRRYRPGAGLDRLRVPPHALSLAERAEPLVKLLRAEIDETASFMVRKGWEAEAVVTAASGQHLRYAIDPGTRKPLHGLAAGRAMLSLLSAAELDRYFAECPRARLTQHTVVAEAELRAAIAQARHDGIAEVCQEDTLGICGLAAAVQAGGEDLSAFAVAIPEARFAPALAEQARAALRRAAAALAADPAGG